MKGLGYRQLRIIGALRKAGRAVPTGYLTRSCEVDRKTANMSLRGLEARGLVVHVRHGWWAAA